MNDNCLDITFLSLPERAQATLQIYLKGAGREVFREVAENQAEIAVFDFDHPASRAHWEQFGKDYKKPGIVLSIAEQNFPDAVWVGKPVTATTLAKAAAQLRAQLRNSSSPTTTATGNNVAAHATRVALLSLEPRNEAALNMFFRGEGRPVFSPSAEEDAEAAIFDYDHPASRAHWEQFRERYGRPGILFSIVEQSLAGTVWVRKPVTGAGLLSAAKMLQHVAPNPTPAETLAPPLTPSSIEAAAEASAETAAPTPVPEAPQAALPQGDPATPVRNWVHAPDEQKKPPVLLWIAAGLALIVGLWFWLRPAGEPTHPLADNSATTPPVQANPASAPSTDTLRAAVDTSVAQYQAKSATDQSFITAQMDELYKRGAGAIEDVKAKLDRLTSDPKAQAEHSQSVYNKVHIAPETPTNKSVGDAAERDLRSRIESVVGTAVAEPKGDAFASALKPETKVREAEMRTITVKKGDTLSGIAQRAYGDAALYMKIFEANPRVLTSPDHVFPDQVLRVPLN